MVRREVVGQSVHKPLFPFIIFVCFSGAVQAASVLYWLYLLAARGTLTANTELGPFDIPLVPCLNTSVVLWLLPVLTILPQFGSKAWMVAGVVALSSVPSLTFILGWPRPFA